MKEGKKRKRGALITFSIQLLHIMHPSAKGEHDMHAQKIIIFFLTVTSGKMTIHSQIVCPKSKVVMYNAVELTVFSKMATRICIKRALQSAPRTTNVALASNIILFLFDFFLMNGVLSFGKQKKYKINQPVWFEFYIIDSCGVVCGTSDQS